MSRYKKPLTVEEIAKLRDEDIDFSDIPETDEAFWADAELVMPEPKKSVHLRIDPDVLEWFRAQGKGHLTRMNAVLRSYYEAHKNDGVRK
ncbi:MAG: BrnA antitoxin family protein [Rhodospirillales bacterium]|nr:BrnA antitoxin family protein [Rhodospirillales bacterium]MCB9996690.1 BrnA antitoxin family protein [Rhodospirillales bacterium]